MDPNLQKEGQINRPKFGPQTILQKNALFKQTFVIKLCKSQMRTTTFILEASTALLAKCIFIIWTNTIIFWTNTVIIWINTIILGTAQKLPAITTTTETNFRCIKGAEKGHDSIDE